MNRTRSGRGASTSSSPSDAPPGRSREPAVGVGEHRRGVEARAVLEAHAGAQPQPPDGASPPKAAPTAPAPGRRAPRRTARRASRPAARAAAGRRAGPPGCARRADRASPGRAVERPGQGRRAARHAGGADRRGVRRRLPRIPRAPAPPARRRRRSARSAARRQIFSRTSVLSDEQDREEDRPAVEVALDQRAAHAGAARGADAEGAREPGVLARVQEHQEDQDDRDQRPGRR